MDDKAIIEQIENDFYELVGQIEYGEMSNIDAYWKTLGSFLMKLNLRNWEKPEDKETAPVSMILESMGEIVDKDLLRITSEMENLSEGGSIAFIDPEDLEELQALTTDFEFRFEDFLNKLREL